MTERTSNVDDRLTTKILVADDNSLVRQILQTRLERDGFVVVTAKTGKETLLRARETKPHVICLDLSMPEMTGWDAAAKLKSDATLCHTPIIAVTACALPGDRERAIAAGCDEYETKPIHFPSLLKKVHSLVSRHRRATP